MQINILFILQAAKEKPEEKLKVKKMKQRKLMKAKKVQRLIKLFHIKFDKFIYK